MGRRSVHSDSRRGGRRADGISPADGRAKRKRCGKCGRPSPDCAPSTVLRTLTVANRAELDRTVANDFAVLDRARLGHAVARDIAATGEVSLGNAAGLTIGVAGPSAFGNTLTAASLRARQMESGAGVSVGDLSVSGATSVGGQTRAGTLDVSGLSSIGGALTASRIGTPSLVLRTPPGGQPVALVSGATALGPVTFTLPPDNGAPGFVLKTDSTGKTFWGPPV